MTQDLKYFAAIQEFGTLSQTFIPQHTDDWDNLHSSTRQNCSYVWAETIEELEALWWEKCGEEESL